MKGFLVRNVSSEQLENVRVKVVEAGQSASDYSHLEDRAIMPLRYTRRSTGKQETIYLALTPIRVTSELDDIDLKIALSDGLLQVSADTFRWGNFAEVGPLATQEDVQIFARYKKLDALRSAQNYTFIIRNIGTDTLESAVLDACCAGETNSDTLSLDSITWTEHLQLGDLEPGTEKTVKVITYQLSSNPAPGEIVVESVPKLGGEQPYPTPTVLGSLLVDLSGSGRYYASLTSIREYLKTINVNIVSSDEELLDLMLKAANQIDRATRRRFDLVTVTERYDGVGQQKLVLDNYPIVSIQEVKIRNPDNQIVTDIKSTDANFASEIIMDAQNGFITLPSAGIPMLGSQLGALGWYPPIYAYQPFPAAGVPFDYTTHFGRGIANIEVTYTYGFQVPPEGIRDACMKMVVIEMLKKKGASDTQGSSVVSIAGMSETFTQQGGQQAGSGPFAHMIAELQRDIDATLELFRKRRWGVV